MNKSEAYDKDCREPAGFYVDLTGDSNYWAVFGTESGFCYGLFCDKNAAEQYCGTLYDYTKIDW